MLRMSNNDKCLQKKILNDTLISGSSSIFASMRPFKMADVVPKTPLAATVTSILLISKGMSTPRGPQVFTSSVS